MSVNTAMILGAGLGLRMRPLTEKLPKPMVALNGVPLIDRILDRLAAAGIENAVVNVHYLGDILEAHLKNRHSPKVTISDERDELLDTGGGIARALPLLGDDAFLVHNSDSLSCETEGSNLKDLIDQWKPDEMDTLLLIAPVENSLGYDGRGDFILDPAGRIERPEKGADAPYVFTGVSIAAPRLFRDAPSGAFSLNTLWSRAISEGRAFGVVHKGLWMHIGTPGALSDAEDACSK